MGRETFEAKHSHECLEEIERERRGSEGRQDERGEKEGWK
jgi:hypothetical protein